MSRDSTEKLASRTESQKAFITIDGEKFEIGDCILVKGEASKKPFVGKIKSFRNQSKGLSHTKVNVSWYYRPEECKAGRRQFHGEKELFKSKHTDLIDAETILQKCDVHTITKYRELEEEDDADFYSRFSYDPSEDKFAPDHVPVFCVCELPYNPDTYMIMCGQCEDWFHPSCVNISQSKLKKYDSEQFYCPECTMKRSGSKKRAR